MNMLSTKTHVMFLLGGDKHFLTDKQATSVKQALIDGKKYIDIEGVFFSAHQFAKIIYGADYEEAERIKHGEWKCKKHDNWIPKGRQCGLC